MDGNAFTLLLRLIHILAGIFWVGAAFLMAGFILAYGIGGLAAILAAVAGLAISGSAGRRMMAIVQGSEGGRPTPDQLAEIAQLQARSNSGMRIAAGLLVISAGAMAIARYL